MDLLTALKRRYWHLLVHRCQVAEPNQFVRFNWFEEEIVVYNDNGNVIIFDNICPHRGARIFSEGEGRKHLRCRYHGWSYKNGCFSAPFPQKFEPEELARARFRTIRPQWCGDWLFGSIDPMMSLEEQLGETIELLVAISQSIAAPYSAYRFEWQSDWRIALENAIEEYHTEVGLVHPGSFGRYKTKNGRDTFHAMTSVFRCEYASALTVNQLRRLGRFFDLRFQWDGYQSIYLFPFAMIGSTFGYSYALQHFFPSKTSDVNHFTSHMLTSKLRGNINPEILTSFFASSDDMNRKIFEEDHAICRRVSPHSLGSEFEPIFAISERKIRKFRQWLARVAEVATKTTAGATTV